MIAFGIGRGDAIWGIVGTLSVQLDLDGTIFLLGTRFIPALAIQREVLPAHACQCEGVALLDCYSLSEAAIETDAFVGEPFALGFIDRPPFEEGVAVERG